MLVRVHRFVCLFGSGAAVHAVCVAAICREPGTKESREEIDDSTHILHAETEKTGTRLSMLWKSLSTTHTRSHTDTGFASIHSILHKKYCAMRWLLTMVMVIHACAVACVRAIGTILQVNDFEWVLKHTRAYEPIVCMCERVRVCFGR